MRPSPSSGPVGRHTARSLAKCTSIHQFICVERTSNMCLPFEKFPISCRSNGSYRAVLMGLMKGFGWKGEGVSGVGNFNIISVLREMLVINTGIILNYTYYYVFIIYLILYSIKNQNLLIFSNISNCYTIKIYYTLNLLGQYCSLFLTLFWLCKALD